MPGRNTCAVGREWRRQKHAREIHLWCTESRDSGQIRWEGKHQEVSSPNVARKLGIGMVFQHFSLFDAMTVEENISVGIVPELAKGDLANRITEISRQYGLPLDPKRYVHTLFVGERQRIGGKQPPVRGY